MSAYILGCFGDVEPSPDLATYGAKVASTLEPYGGRFLARDLPAEVLEGPWPGQVAVIAEFPDRERAAAWHASEAYQKLVPLRTGHSRGWIIVLDDATAQSGPVLASA
jgi:uncharacterized protein (DUF1330 family)